MKTLKDYILESQQSQEEYFSEMLLCDKDSEFIKILIDFINDPNAKFTALGYHPDLIKIAKALNIGDEWVKKFKNKSLRDLDDLIDTEFNLNSKSFFNNDKILSGTRFKECFYAMTDYILDIDSTFVIDDEEYIFNVFFKFNGRRRKAEDKVPEAIRDNILYCMKNGFITQLEDGKRVKYGISKENISDIVDPEYCNAEQLKRLIDKYESKGVKWKYETNEEWKKAGLKDPTED